MQRSEGVEAAAEAKIPEPEHRCGAAVVAGDAAP